MLYDDVDFVRFGFADFLTLPSMHAPPLFHGVDNTMSSDAAMTDAVMVANPRQAEAKVSTWTEVSHSRVEDSTVSLEEDPVELDDVLAGDVPREAEPQEEVSSATGGGPQDIGPYTRNDPEVLKIASLQGGQASDSDNLEPGLPERGKVVPRYPWTQKVGARSP